MTAGGRRTGNLAARIVRATLAIAVVTALAAGIVSSIGAFRLAASQAAAADQATLQFIEDQLVDRLSSAESIASRVAAIIASSPETTGLRARIAPIFDSRVVDKIIVANRGGRVVAAYPSSAETSSVSANSAFVSAITGTTGFHREPGAPTSAGLWLTRAATGPSRTQLVILVHLDLKTMADTIRQMREIGQRSLWVLDSGTPIVHAGLAEPGDLNRARWTGTGPSGGEVEIPSPGGDDQSGLYTDVQGIEGIAWRIAVLEPSSVLLKDAAIAVMPSVLVLLIAGGFAVFAAWIVARRLVEPLRTLEVAAYRAATGSYVKPIVSERDDEVGQVADAFNAVALRLNALHDLSQLLASASHLDQVLDGILSAMGHIVGPGVAAIYLLDDSRQWLVPAAARGADISQIRKVDALGQSWLASALREGDSISHSGDAERLVDELPGLAGPHSVALVAPLISGQEALGVVVVLKDKADPVTEAEREMVRTFSAQAAIAVHNSRLFAEESESRRISEGLRAVAEQLVRADGLEQSLRHVEAVVMSLFGAVAASFAVMDRQALGLPPLAEHSDERTLFAFATRALARFEGRRALVVRPGEDADGDTIMAKTGADSLLVVPVAVEEPHGGVLVISLSDVTTGELQYMIAEAVANELALALENAYLFERALTRASNLETIFRISQAVGSSLQVNVVLNRVLDVVQKILSADAVALMNYDPRRRVIVTTMARGAVSADIVDVRLAPGEDVPGYVFSTGEPAAYRDLKESMGGIAGNAASHGLRSMLAVPMLARGRSIGVLVVFSAEPGAFSDEDMNVLQTFAAQAALAADTARMFSREHEVATVLQASILPEDLPEYDEVEAASAYQPAGADVEIGGDYYDLFKSPDGAVWFAIADVCGKGVLAATKTTRIKYSVRSLVAAGLGPASVLGEVNRMVAETGEPNDIVTLWVGRYDPPTGSLSWSSGGHPPAALLRRDLGEVDWLPPTGPLLGALADVVYGEESVSLAEGDMVLLYTDGVTETRNGNVFFGEQRVRESVIAGGTPRELVRRLLAAVRRFGRGELRDDVALLALTIRKIDSEAVAHEERSDT